MVALKFATYQPVDLIAIRILQDAFIRSSGTRVIAVRNFAQQGHTRRPQLNSGGIVIGEDYFPVTTEIKFGLAVLTEPLGTAAYFFARRAD